MKKEIVNVRMSKECKELINKVAASKGVSSSEYIRFATIDAALCDERDYEITKEDTKLKDKSNKLYISLSPDLDKKISDMAEELGATKQQAIRRLLREGNIYDLRIYIDLEEEFLSLTSQIKVLNNMISGIYSVVKKSDGVFTKREVDHMYQVMHEIRDSSYEILSSVFTLCGQVKDMARKRMEKLIKERICLNKN